MTNRRKSLTRDIRKWREQYLKVAPEVETVLENRDELPEAEDDTLHLPSDFSQKERKDLGLIELGVIELKLREGEANEAVIGVCNALTHENLLAGFQKRNARGVRQNTRSHKIINHIKEKRHEHAAVYRHCRSKVLSLSNSPQGLDGYPVLLNEDMYQKNAAESRVLGDGKKTDSWIWSYGSLRGLDQREKASFLKQCMY